jgi:hypothetical protein
MARNSGTQKAGKTVGAIIVPRSRTLEMLKHSISAPEGLVNINTIDGLMKVNEGIFYDLAHGASLDELRLMRQVSSDHRKYLAMMLSCGFNPQQFFSKGIPRIEAKQSKKSLSAGR